MLQCYCGGARPSRIVQPLVIQRTPLRRALAASVVLHAVALVAWWMIAPAAARDAELVDIEVAPTPPRPEALPPEVARPPLEQRSGHEDDREPASTAPSQPGDP